MIFTVDGSVGYGGGFWIDDGGSGIELSNPL